MFKFNEKFDPDSLLYLLSNFECDSHTVHMLTQWHLPPPSLTSTVKLSLFIHEHSSSLSLAARLHQCCTNHSRYMNNGSTFSGQTSYICKTTNSWAPCLHVVLELEGILFSINNTNIEYYELFCLLPNGSGMTFYLK